MKSRSDRSRRNWPIFANCRTAGTILASIEEQGKLTPELKAHLEATLEKTELEWIHLGFEDDDETMTERRLRQGNLVGAAGYISMEDGCVGGFVQRALQYNDDDSGVVMMGGHDAESQTFRASEAAIRGFWKKYRALTGA